MLNLTREERRAILFLTAVILTGLIINFSLKINSRAGEVIRVDDVYIGKQDINRVSHDDLIYTVGIGANLAKKIIAYRNAHGPFRNPEELKKIKGIGDYRYKKLKELFYFR